MGAFDARPCTGEDAMRLLLRGNGRWAAGTPTHPHVSLARRAEAAQAQSPFAVILSCIDSRVPPELIFDRGIGDVFVVRTAAQTLDAVPLGSIRFGPTVLGTPLVFVLGHQRCGAVTAATEVLQRPDPVPGPLHSVVEALRPAYDAARQQSGDLVDNVVRSHTRLTVDVLVADAVLRDLVRQDRLMVVGGYYSLDSGEVHVIASPHNHSAYSA
jgi:carbonic anhydrase